MAVCLSWCRNSFIHQNKSGDCAKDGGDKFFKRSLIEFLWNFYRFVIRTQRILVKNSSQYSLAQSAIVERKTDCDRTVLVKLGLFVKEGKIDFKQYTYLNQQPHFVNYSRFIRVKFLRPISDIAPKP